MRLKRQVNTLAVFSLQRRSRETCPEVWREEAGTGVLAAGVVVASEQLFFRPFQAQEGLWGMISKPPLWRLRG